MSKISDLSSERSRFLPFSNYIFNDVFLRGVLFAEISFVADCAWALPPK